MSVIIRLQNLPWSANALDIRQYFQGLSIPEGGVHIVGGEQGDAFIAFSTDEDARQAFNRNNGKIKEVQISLNLSSRTEMQRVIEAARAKSYAAFMQPNPNPTPLPAIVPAAVPSAVPDVKKDENNKRDRKRSRSRSRDRKDRSRDRDRNRRHRDRSRSRDRRDRRRRDRSRSRGRSRSKERDRRNNSRDNKRIDNNRNANRDNNKPKPQVWSNQIPNNDALSNIQQGLLGATFPINLEETAHNLNMLNSGMAANGFLNNFHNNNRGRPDGGWPQANFSHNQPGNFQNFNNNFHPANNLRGQMQNNFGNRPFQRNDNYNQYEGNDPIDKNSCIQLESFFGGYSDVRRFFQGIFISNKGIKFINDENGQRTGIVYVQFGHHQGKLEALRKNGEMLSGSKVQVSHLEDSVFENAVDRYVPQDDYYNDNGDDTKNMRSKFKLNRISRFDNNDSIKEFTCLMVDDLPTYVKEQDILHMFSSHPLFSLILTNKPRGGHIAYVKFSNKEVAKMALEEQSHHVVNGKQVTVLPCSDEDFEKINKEHDPNLEESNNTTPNIGTDCLSISRLPMKTKDKDIADFFSDIGIIPSKIHLMNNPMGVFTGQAYCVFETIKDASLAAEKDDTMLGNVPISVKPIMHSEMQSILNNLTHTTPQSPVDNRSSMMPNHHGAPMMQQQSHQNLPFFNRNFDGGRGPPPPRFGGHRGGGPPPRHRFGGGNGGFQHMNNGPMDEAPPGCTVFMDNVPYKAGTNEILDFFDGYDITNNVSRRYNPNNTPSAEAKVIFNSADEAFRAVKEKNGDKIWDRPIYLTQA